jgi:hypothetical protein
VSAVERLFGEAIGEELAHQRRLIRQGHEAPADIPRWQHAELVAEPPGIPS